MPTFKILDELNTPLLEVDTDQNRGLGKYLRDAVRLRALRPAAGALQRRLSEAPTNPVALEFSVPETVALGGGDLTLDAGVRAGIGVHQPDELLFPADDLRDAISVPSGTAYVSIGLAPRVKAGLQGDHGALALGFSAGASLSYRYYHPFDIAGTDPQLSAALAHTITCAALPADLDDLAALPPGAVASVEGEGEVQLTASVELSSVTNPLATPGLPVIGAASVSAGASVAVGGEWRATGAFEIRASKLAPDRVRLSYYKRAGSEITIDATASVGVSTRIGDSDAIQKFLSAVSSDPEADLVQLINAGLTDAQIEALQQAIARSVDRSLRIATEMQFSSVRRGEALFAYDIDLPSLDDGGRAAVTAALRGRLTAINEAARGGGGAIRAVQTGLLRQRDKRISWRINLFGIVNVHSVSELLRKGTLSYDSLTGTLNAADEIASEQILVKTRPFEADGEKIRKLVFESMIVTAAYQASRVSSSLTLNCAASYFESRHKTTAADVRSDYNAIIGMALSDANDRDRRIGAEHDFGPSTFLLECAFDQRAADALFLGPDGPFARAYYERVGRNALLALIPPDDAERAHRRAAVEHEASWAALRDAGPAAARVDLARRFGDIRAEHIIGDYVLIQWWADAMADAARALVEMRQFLAGRTADALAGDPQFARQREKLEKELADVVKRSKSRFGDPWGILALDSAANRAPSARATLVSPRLTAVYESRVLPAARVAAALPAVAAGEMARAGRDEAKRPFTPEEVELLRRHAINLRLGAFSSDGEFKTDEADVRRLFTELLPAEIAERKAAGQKARVIFYAHGGLIGEREGLEPVLRRLKFWRQNNVYPVSFVWETGLRETITDIVRGLAGARDVAARGIGEDVADAFLEFAAREGGKRVWGQMKRSAEVSVLEGGGAAVVARLARELWNAHHQDLEFHAAGHSAGAIFQAHFLPALLAAGPQGPALTVKTLHLLAPACTTELFHSKLRPLVGNGIEALTMYTMNKALEQADTAGPYRKSLLYLVSRAFETEQPAPILGLEDSIRQDARLIRFFGLAGNQKAADLLFAKTAMNAPLDARSLSTSHGGFDDDVATMSSLMRRMLGAPESVSIVDFFQEDIAPAAGERASVADAVAASIERTSHAAAAVVTPPARPAIVTAPSRAGRRLALCVGIDKYGPPHDLAGCVNDARSWAQALQGRGFEVTSLHDQAASLAAVMSAFRALVRGAQAGDVVVFQFAGHGTQVDDLDGDEQDDAFDEAFCPADFAEGKLLIDDDIRAATLELKPGVNLTCFIDCCHSGTITRALVPTGRPAAALPGSRARFIPYSREIADRHRRFRTAGGAGDARAVSAAVAAAGAPATMKEVCFSACQPHEVALESNGAGQFTSKAMVVLSSGVELSNAAFMEQVLTVFGARPPQHPYLDCAEEARHRGLLQPLGVAAPF